MGFRTVVMLNNDLAHEWQNDKELGRKISRAMACANRKRDRDDARVDNYGEVVECVHADCQTLAVIDSYTDFEVIAAKGWARDEKKDEVALKLLKEAAAALGYRLVKRPAEIGRKQ